MNISEIGSIDLFKIFDFVKYDGLIENGTLFSIFRWSDDDNKEELKEICELFNKYGVVTCKSEKDEFYNEVLQIDLDDMEPKLIVYKEEAQQIFYEFFRKNRQKIYAKILRKYDGRYYWDENT
jgi:hypothetical protein